MNAEDVILEVSHLEKSFGSHDVLRDISFQVAKGDVVSVIGASGSGKSTMLRCVNLLETPTGGSILYHGEDITDPKINVPAYRSKVGMVFQSFNLFNNMTVLENCMVGQIKVAGRKKEEAEEKAMAYLKKVDMDAYINAKPRQLSGGQKQRVAVAVSMICKKELLVFDEPTSGLDYDSMVQVAGLFGALRAAGKLVFVVTHDYEFACRICTRVLHLDQGKLLDDLAVEPGNLEKIKEIFSVTEKEKRGE